jgi:hypothetical protein
MYSPDLKRTDAEFHVGLERNSVYEFVLHAPGAAVAVCSGSAAEAVRDRDMAVP